MKEFYKYNAVDERGKGRERDREKGERKTKRVLRVFEK